MMDRFENDDTVFTTALPDITGLKNATMEFITRTVYDILSSAKRHVQAEVNIPVL